MALKKRWAALVFALLLILSLAACRQAPAKESGYSEADIQAAKDIVTAYFQTHFTGCTLLKLYYDEANARNAEQEKAKLNERKSSALNEIRNYLDKSNYKAAQQAEINSIINDYSSSVNSASSIEEVNSILSNAKDALDNVSTASEIDNENSRLAEESRKANEEAVNTARENALALINSYVDKSNYYSAQQSEIDSIISSYTSAISDSTSVDDINALVYSTEAELDGVLTKSQVDSNSPGNDSDNNETQQDTGD